MFTLLLRIYHVPFVSILYHYFNGMLDSIVGKKVNFMFNEETELINHLCRLGWETLKDILYFGNKVFLVCMQEEKS